VGVCWRLGAATARMAEIDIVAVATRAGQKFIGPRKHITFSQRNPFFMGRGPDYLCALNRFFGTAPDPMLARITARGTALIQNLT